MSLLRHAQSRQRLCKWCKAPVRGRRDKIFCSVECKAAYHYELKNQSKDAANTIDKILHRNRSILLEIMGQHSTQRKTLKSELDQKKFNYSHITGYHINSKGKMVHHVYDFSYMILADQDVMIYRRKK